MHCEFSFKPAHLCPATFPFQFAKLLGNAAEPGGRLPLTDCAVAERGVFVKDGELSVEISDGCEWCDGLGKLLFKGVLSILLIERNCVVTGWTAGWGMSS